MYQNFYCTSPNFLSFNHFSINLYGIFSNNFIHFKYSFFLYQITLFSKFNIRSFDFRQFYIKLQLIFYHYYPVRSTYFDFICIICISILMVYKDKIYRIFLHNKRTQRNKVTSLPYFPASVVLDNTSLHPVQLFMKYAALIR